MYLVRFYRADGKPDEEYYYVRESDAKYHFALFDNDTSNLYRKISMEHFDTHGLTTLRIRFFY